MSSSPSNHSHTDREGSCTSSTSSQPRKKTWAPKTRTGCKTCRLRRVKCDEGTPVCQRCIKGGRNCVPCDKFSVNKTWKTKKHKFAPLRVPVTFHQPEDDPAQIALDASDTERRWFEFFQAGVISHIAGPFDQGYWTLDLLRASRLYECVWFACIALAASYRDCVEGGGALPPPPSPPPPPPGTTEVSGDEPVMALKAYITAISKLGEAIRRRDLSFADKQAVLVSILLISISNCLRGDKAEAALHVSSGTELFLRWKFWQYRRCTSEGPAPLVSTDFLIAAFSSLDTQIMHTRGTWNSLEWMNVLETVSEGPFRSVSDAYVELEVLINGVAGLQLNSSKEEASEEVSSLIAHAWTTCRQAYSTWLEHFDLLLNAGLHSSEEQIAMIMLDCRRLLLELAIFQPLTKEERENPYSQETLIQVNSVKAIALAEFAIERQAQRCRNSSDSSPGKSRPDFPLSPYIGECLYWLARFCRDETIRQRALKLLKRNPSIQGAQMIDELLYMTESVMDDSDQVPMNHMFEECDFVSDSYSFLLHPVHDYLWLGNLGCQDSARGNIVW